MLTAKQMKAVALLFDGKTQKEAADILGISEKTVGRWKNLQEFKRELQNMSDNYLSEIRAKMIRNQEKLALNAHSEMVRFSATKDLLDRVDTINEKVSDEPNEDDGVKIIIGEPKKYEPRTDV